MTPTASFASSTKRGRQSVADPLASRRRERERLLDLARAYAEGLRARLDLVGVVVVGSVARGEADEWSDLDLVIIADTARPFLDRYLDFTGIYDVWPRLDLIIYTPGEFARMRAEGRAFIEHVEAEGVVVHEAPAES